MQAVLYWLEDHFDALSEECEGRFSYSVARRMSMICGGLGDMLAMRAHSKALLMPPENR